MSGKNHSFIGIVVSIILWIGYTIGACSLIDIKLLIIIMLGSIVGSLIVDIDTKKSKASQYLARGLTIVVWIYLIIIILYKYNIIDIKKVFPMIMISLSYLRRKYGILLFCILITLGKLSPHRQFTHKFFGTLLFCTTAYVTFNKYFAIGFILGYICHIIADKMTPAGVRFLEFKLPLVDRKGNFKINF